MAPRLACNYSEALARLLDGGAVDVDLLNLTRLDVVEQELDLVLPRAPALLHMMDRAGRPEAARDAFAWDRFDRMLQRAGAPHTGLHLELRQEDWHEPVRLCHQDRAQALAMMDRLRGSVRTAMSRLHVPVLLENVPYLGERGTVRLTAEPAVMWQLVDEGAGILLDVAHLRCTAHQLGIEVRSYARSLPLAAVRELHVSGPREGPEGGMQDRHDVLSAEDYGIIAWILERTDPVVVTLEYGGTDPEFAVNQPGAEPALVEQLRRLREICGR